MFQFRIQGIIPVVDKGLQEAMQSGVLAGYPMIDVKCTLFDGSYHDVDRKNLKLILLMCYNRIVLGGSDYIRSTLAQFSPQMAG